MIQPMIITTQTISKRTLPHRNATMFCVLAVIFLSAPHTSVAGGVCIVAKELGNSLAIEWVASEKDTVTGATEKAKASLQQQGFTKKKLQDLHVQASTSLMHAHMIIIKTSYKTQIGKLRTSYGCGFSHISLANAERVAVDNLRSYSWGWKPEFGYEIYARFNY